MAAAACAAGGASPREKSEGSRALPAPKGAESILRAPPAVRPVRRNPGRESAVPESSLKEEKTASEDSP